jgi:hypothetical protein
VTSGPPGQDWFAHPAGRVAAGSFAAIALAVAIVCATRANGYFLADDFVLLAQFQRWRDEGTLLPHLLAKLWETIGGDNWFWRPFTLWTFAINFVVHGANGRAWVATNLLLHLACALLVALLAWRVAADRTRAAALGAAVAACLFFVLSPGWEVGLWTACRFDAFATLFTLAAGCLFLTKRYALALLCGGLALMSKESGALAIVLVACLAVQRAWDAGDWRAGGWRAAAQRIAPWVALGTGYVLLRVAIFGSPFRVYASSDAGALGSIERWGDVARSLAGWAQVNFPGSTALAVAGAFTVFVIVSGARLAASRGRGALAPQAAIGAMVAAALALLLPHVAEFEFRGAGGRLFYQSGAFLAVLVGLAIREAALAWTRRLPLAALVLAAAGGLLALHGHWGAGAVRQYLSAQKNMRALAGAVEREAAAAPGSGHTVLFVRNALGRVPFARNAQAGVVLPPVQPAALSARVLVQTDREFGHIDGYVVNGLFAQLAKHALLDVAEGKIPPQNWPRTEPAAYRCWVAARREFVTMELTDPFAELLSDRLESAFTMAGCGG